MKCEFCEFRCDLEKGEGVCKRYIYKEGRIEEKEPMMFMPPAYYRIEEMPFFHVNPGENILRLGTVSCNAGCEFCINSHISMENPDTPLHPYTEDHIVREALLNGCRSIVFALNEVTCYIPSAVKVADAAHKAGLKVGCLTNGFQTEETAELLAEKMDFINVSLKSMDDEFYKKELHLPSVEPVIRNVKLFAKKTHLELTTPLSEELTMEKLLEMAQFIASLSPDIPWHLFRLQPSYHVDKTRSLSAKDINDILENTSKYLRFVYVGNLAGSRWVNTLCPKCGETLVRRVCIGSCGSKFNSMEFDGKHCPRCGEEIAMLTEE